MRRPVVQTLLAWLCLIAFGLSSTVFSNGLVLCSDSQGTRLEWGCNRNARGECKDSRAPRSSNEQADGCCPGDSAPDPCKETPVKSNLSAVAGSLFRASDTPTVPQPVAVAIPSVWVPEPVALRPRPNRALCLGPPGAVERLRTVILLV